MLHKAFAIVLASVIFLPLLGCRDAYQVAMDDQISNYNEMVTILQSVKDPASMEAAEAKWKSRLGHFRDTGRRVRELPPPSPDDLATLERMKDKAPALQKSMMELRTELARIRELPGGPQFLEKISPSGDPLKGPLK